MSAALSSYNAPEFDRFIKIPYIQIRNNTAILYDHFLNPPAKKHKSGFYQNFDITSKIENFKGSQTYSGAVTPGAKKTMGRAISLMVQSTPNQFLINPVTGNRCKFKMNFITLTVSDRTKNLEAKEAHKMLLEPMLKHFRDVYNMKSYVWKAEMQKRGQIHYHITTDFFIHMDKLRDKWNQLQDKNGLLNDFYARFGHKNPNSTDVHSVYKLKNIEAYLIKYMQKNGGPDKAALSWQKKFSEKSVIKTSEGYLYTALPGSYFNHIQKCYTKGKIWDCSQNLKQAKYYTTVMDSTNKENIEKLIVEKKCTIEFNDHYTFLKFKDLPASCVLSEQDKINYKIHLESIRGYDVKIKRLNLDQAIKAPDIPRIKINAVQTRLIFVRNYNIPIAYQTG